MKKTFALQDLECANCASKMECDINKLQGVNCAKVNFMASKLMIDAEDDSFSQVLEQAQQICSEYERDCLIVR